MTTDCEGQEEEVFSLKLVTPHACMSEFAHSVAHLVQELRKQLQGLQQGLLVDNAGLASASAHPYFGMNIAQEKHHFTEAIAKIKSRLLQLRKWVESEDEAAVRRMLKHSHDREETQNRVKHVQATINNCQQIAMAYFETAKTTALPPKVAVDGGSGIAVTTDDATHRKNVISCLRTCAARVPGIQFYESPGDEPDSLLISIAALSFLVDIKVNKYGKIEKTSVATSVEDPFLSDLLQKELAEERFSEFERLLKHLAARFRRTDQLAVIVPDCKSFLQVLQSDIESITSHEASLASPQECLSRHHGLLQKTIDGSTLYFYASPLALVARPASLETPDFNDPHIAAARVSIELSATHSVPLSNKSVVGQLLHTKNSSGSFVEWNIDAEAPKEVENSHAMSFFLTLNRPIPIRVDALRRILQKSFSSISRASSLSSSGGNHTQQHDVHFSDSSTPGLSFIDVILAEGRQANFGAMPKQHPIDGSVDAYWWIGESSGLYKYQNFKHFAGGPETVLVQRIPFVHLSQLRPILELLRQQLTFAELYRSCFFSEQHVDPHAPAIVKQSRRLSMSTTAISVEATPSKKRKAPLDDDGLDQPHSHKDMTVFVQPIGKSGLQLLVSNPKNGNDPSKKRKLDESNAAIAATKDATAFTKSTLVLELQVLVGGQIEVDSPQKVDGQPSDNFITRIFNASANIPLALHQIVHTIR